MFLRVLIVAILQLLATFMTLGQTTEQNSETVFEVVELAGGRSVNSVNNIVQDSFGFLWFGTQGGVLKYDGYRHTLFAHDPFDSTTLGNNWVEWLYLDKNHDLWVGSWGGGLNRLDMATGRFKRYMHDSSNPNSLSDNEVTTIVEDAQGRLWVGTGNGGINRFDLETESFTRYLHDPSDSASLSQNQVRIVYTDRTGTLWIGCGFPWSEPGTGGLNRYNPLSDNFTRYLHDTEDESTLAHNKVQALYEDTDGTFWVGTVGNGLHTMSRVEGRFKRHYYDSLRPEKLSRPYAKSSPSLSAITGIRWFLEDRNRNLWIGAFEGGLNRYNLTTRRLTHFESDPGNPHSLSNNFVWTMLESRDGTIWVGTGGGGGQLNKIAATKPKIPMIIPDPAATHEEKWIQAIYEDQRGNLWIGKTNGLMKYNPQTGSHQRYLHQPYNPKSIPEGEVLTIEADKQNHLWLGIKNLLKGTLILVHFDPIMGHFTQVPLLNDSTHIRAVDQGWILDILEDRDSTLWIGTRLSGLFHYNPLTQHLDHFRFNLTESLMQQSDFINSIFEDSKGQIWMGTGLAGVRSNTNNLYWFDRASQSIIQFPHNSTDPNGAIFSAVLGISETADGKLWLGTSDNGLYMVDPKSHDVMNFNMSNSEIPSDQIRGILLSNEGHLWLSTQHHLVEFDPDLNTFFTYDRDRGAVGSFVGSVFKNSKGKLFFGGNDGISTFFPAQLRSKGKSVPPRLLLTGFRIFNQPMTPSPRGPLKDPIWQTSEIRLGYNQNSFSIEFAGIHYHNPKQNRHIYKLEGYDHSWKEADSRTPRADYVNMAAGKYTFRLRAATGDGIWSNETKSLLIIVSPPWWKEWWAYALLFSLTLLLIYYGYRIQGRRIRAKERERSMQKELAQAKEIQKAYDELQMTQKQLIQSEKMASLGELTAGIAHEIQNPLNFVNNFSEINEELVEELRNEINQGNRDQAIQLLEDLHQNEEKIKQHGRRAEGIVKSMLQHSRSRPGKKELTNINELVDEYLRLAYHGMRAKDKLFQAEFHTDLDPQMPKINVISQDIGRVILNVINNAFQAVLETSKDAVDRAEYKPKVNIRTKDTERMVEIRISDNGSGIPDEIKNKVFQPFFTTKPAGQGTGLGLSLSYDIVQAHNGEMEIGSNVKEGAEMIIRLPKN